ncbi:ArsR family transcriptional regulator [Candidatus Amarolinea dominans]|uniref:helix-turn-helix transcriptional regulator n=1 Tax=Candidatus Amarolinea dominans TaxID=3140696 RepID=UPI001D5E2A00|nr:ArsR family transcriptional regulator [Anaerolineae bacterium]MBK7203677.1 ArsR family transcriptional regulator [Anaerolineae bacterium]
MQATRRRILEILKIENKATVMDLAQALDMAPVSVRHHLDILQGQDLVTSLVQHKRTVGRPEQVYLLTAAANDFFPQSFRALATDVLHEVKRLLPASALNGIIERLAERTLAEAPLARYGQSVDERVADVTTFLSDKGYLAQWEHHNGRQLLLHTCNCPYAGLAAEHPELCQMDLILVSELMSGLSASAPRCLGRLAAGDGRCSYMFELNHTGEPTGGQG